ncbi:MAG: response regulator [Opitutales bacterium]|nr:response regulator [Opitutales bacterium]MCH8540042.1 response regulator [Opitutales bacterium]
MNHEEYHQSLLDLVHSLPGFYFRCRNTKNWPILIITPGVQDLLGYSPEIFYENSLKFGELIHPEDQHDVWNSIQLSFSERHPYHLNYRLKHANGQYLKVSERGRVLQYTAKEECVLEGYIVPLSSYEEKTEARLTESRENFQKARSTVISLEKRERYLSAINQLQETLLASVSHQIPLDKTVEILGCAAKADRCYYFHNHRSHEGHLLQSMKAEWTRPEISSEINAPSMQNASYDKSFPGLAEKLSKGEIVLGNIDQFPEVTKKIFREQSIQALLLIPVFVQKKFQGFLGFDNCHDAQPWGIDEISLLQAGAHSLGMAWQQHALQNALSHEKEMLSLTLSSLEESVVTFDQEGRIQTANEATISLLGKDLTALKGKTLTSALPLLDPDTHSPLWNLLAPRVLKGESITHPQNALLPNAGGDFRKIYYRLAPIRTSCRQSVTGGMVVFRDATADEKQKEKTWIASRMESVGMLAGGLAHDYNNMLAALSGTLDLFRYTLPSRTEKQERLLANIGDSLSRMKEVTNTLLTFSKGGDPVKTKFFPSSEIKNWIQNHSVKQEYCPVVSIPENLPPIEGDPGQLQQVLHHLLQNAFEASPTQTPVRVEISTNDQATPKFTTTPGSFLNIQVINQGENIPTDILPRVFDPYFSTKPNHTGLGLAVAHSITHRHQGHLFLNNSHQGTVATLLLPIEHEYPSPSPKTASLSEPSSTPSGRINGKTRILVMDDEPSVREVLLMMLESLDYEATAVSHGEAAIEEWKTAMTQANPFALAILDLTIAGGLGGKETIHELRKLDPDIRAIVASGYSNDPVMANAEAHGFQKVLPKPFSLEDLRKALTEVLETEASNS